MSHDVLIRSISDKDVDQVAALWEACGLTVPRNDPLLDIAFCRGAADAEIFVGIVDGTPVATVMTGHDGHRGWLYYLAVAPTMEGRGLGRRMVEHAEGWLKERGVPKVNLMIRDSNADVRGFYEAIGYTCEPRLVMARSLREK